MKLTEKLDMLMEERGIDTAILARESGVPYTTIKSLYDKGYENIKLSTLRKLAKYFDVSLDFIADDDVSERHEVTTIAAHGDMNDFTEKEQEMIEEYIQYILSRRKE